MSRKTINRAGIFILALMLLVPAMPGQALVLKVPNQTLTSWRALVATKAPVGPQVLGEQITDDSTPPPPGDQTTPPPPPSDQRGYQPMQPPMDQSGQPNQPQPYQPGGQPGSTCNVNGVEQPGTCDQYKQGSNMQGDMGRQPGPGMMNESQQSGPGPEQTERFLKDIQRGAKQMGGNLTRLEKQFAQAEKRGITIPQDIKDKLAAAKQILEKMKAATSAEEAQNVDMEELNSLMNDLQQAWQEQVQGQQQLQDMQKGMKSLLNGLKMFERQIVKLEKQKVNVAEVKDKLAKVKAIVTAVQAAKTMEGAMEAGIEDLQSLMEEIDSSRQTLEMLSRWPQIEKQMTSELKRLDQAAKQDKKIVDKLAKKDIDVSDDYNKFVEAINKLKAVKDETSANIKTATGDDAQNIFENVNDNFFSQMEETWQYDRIIKTMSNVTSFSGDFNKTLKQAQATVKALEKKKIDTTELKAILQEAQTQAAAIKELIKVKPLDPEAVGQALADLENIRVDFSNKVEELSGNDMMPMQGSGQFNNQQYDNFFDQADFSQYQNKQPQTPQVQTQPMQ